MIAVKQVMLPEDGTTNTHVNALEHEIKILSSLKHYNIVQYLGTSREANTLNIYLEYIPGGSLSSLLCKLGSLPEEVIALYTRQILHGLEYLHLNNIVHRGTLNFFYLSFLSNCK